MLLLAHNDPMGVWLGVAAGVAIGVAIGLIMITGAVFRRQK